MRYRVTVVEKIIKYLTVAATSEEEANRAGLARAPSLDSTTRGSVEVSSFQISDDNAEVT